MAAKTLFAVFAVLCAFAAANAIPIFHYMEDNEGLPHLNLPVEALRKEMAINPKFNWNTDELLEKIHEAVVAVENKINEVSEEVQNAARTMVDTIENAATQTARKWSDDVQKWADQAARAGVDVKECLSEHKALSNDVIAVIKSDAHKCASEPLADLDVALEGVKAVGPLSKALVAEAMDKVDECRKKDKIGAISVCLVTGMLRIELKAAKLVGEAARRAGVAAAKGVSAGRAVTVCVSSATGHHAAEAKTIVNDTAHCIKRKLNA